MAKTLSEWQAAALWHLEQADTILRKLPSDANASAPTAQAHSFTARAITEAISAKIIT